jgi:hypothetical protein
VRDTPVADGRERVANGVDQVERADGIPQRAGPE